MFKPIYLLLAYAFYNQLYSLPLFIFPPNNNNYVWHYCLLRDCQRLFQPSNFFFNGRNITEKILSKRSNLEQFPVGKRLLLPARLLADWCTDFMALQLLMASSSFLFLFLLFAFFSSNLILLNSYPKKVSIKVYRKELTLFLKAK